MGDVETWFSQEIKNSSLRLSNYTIYRKDRESRGGSLMFAVKSSCKSSLIESDTKTEVLAIDVFFKDIEIRFILCYIPNFF